MAKRKKPEKLKKGGSAHRYEVKDGATVKLRTKTQKADAKKAMDNLAGSYKKHNVKKKKSKKK